MYIMIKYILVITMFILGLYYIFNYNRLKHIEQFENINQRCPNLLIKKGEGYYLFNSRLANVPGVNPIRFDNLEDYVEFIEWQKSQGIKCPILYLQQTYNTQGEMVFKQHPSPTNLMGGLNEYPSISSIHMPFKVLTNETDTNTYNANEIFALQSQDSILTVPKEHSFNSIYNDSSNIISANPMDYNWGGKKYTQSLVDEGYYDEDKVYK